MAEALRPARVESSPIFIGWLLGLDVGRCIRFWILALLSVEILRFACLRRLAQDDRQKLDDR
jgi:hypothetical protein